MRTSSDEYYAVLAEAFAQPAAAAQAEHSRDTAVLPRPLHGQGDRRDWLAEALREEGAAHPLGVLIPLWPSAGAAFPLTG